MGRDKLTGKKVLLVTTDPLIMGKELQSIFEYNGAKVVSPSLSANDLTGAKAIIAAAQDASIDAVVIHQSNIDDRSGLKAARQIAEQLSPEKPVLFSNTSDSRQVRTAVQQAGGKMISTFPSSALIEVADAISQHGKPGMAMGGKAGKS